MDKYYLLVLVVLVFNANTTKKNSTILNCSHYKTQIFVKVYIIISRTVVVASFRFYFTLRIELAASSCFLCYLDRVGVNGPERFGGRDITNSFHGAYRNTLN